MPNEVLVLYSNPLEYSSIVLVVNFVLIVRLDFLDFEMDGGSALNKPCDRDSIDIISSGSSDLGMNALCGKNTGQHLYIPIENQQAQPMIRVITDSRSNSNATRGYKWNIKITQIDCETDTPEIRELRGSLSFHCAL